MAGITVKKVSEHSLRVGNKIVQVDNNGECTALTELSTKEKEALEAWLVENQ